MAELVEDGVPDVPEEASREEPEEEYPVGVKRQVRVLDPEPEPITATAKPPGGPKRSPELRRPSTLRGSLLRRLSLRLPQRLSQRLPLRLLGQSPSTRRRWLGTS